MKNVIVIFVSILVHWSLLDAQTFQWAQQMGGISSDVSKSIAVDASGNVYTAGYFYDTADFDPGPGVFDLTASVTLGSIFVSKVDAAGNFVWAKQIQGTGQSWGLGVDLDQAQHVYVTGFFAGTADFDPGPGSSNLTAANTGEVFILKLNPGGDFEFVQQFASMGFSGNTSAAVDIEIDGSGNIYTTGYFVDTVDFDPGSGVYPLASAGYKDIFVSKLDASGNFLWAKRMGSTAYDEPYALAVDHAGHVYLTGGFSDTVDFDPSAATFAMMTVGTGAEVFISKLDASGNFVWAKHLSGGVGDYFGHGIAVDPDQNVYTTGYINGSVDMDPGAGVLYLGSNIGEPFVSKLNLNGDLVWALTLPTSGFAYGNSIIVGAGGIYLAGAFIGAGDFDPGSGVQTLTSVGNMDIFILNLDSAGGFVNAWQMGGSTTDRGESIFVDATGSIYTTGTFSDAVDFDPGAGSLNFTSFGNTDIFIQKIGGCQLNTGVTVNGNTLHAIQSGVSYQWMDCNLFSPVPGANGQSYSPSTNGSFAVIVSQGACSDTSSCNTVTVTQVEDATPAAGMRLFPNPASTFIFLQGDAVVEKVFVYNAMGSLVQTATGNHFSVAGLPEGVYVVHIQTKAGFQTARFVKR